MPRCDSVSIASSTRAQRPSAPRSAPRAGRIPPQTSELETPRNATLVMDANVPPPEVYKSQAAWYSPPRFELSGSLLFLQPGAGNLEYGTLVSPLPIATPNWSNQSLSPNFSPAFRVGARYMPNESNDIELNWTHLNTTTNGSFSGGPTQMVGPPYLIGPEAALYKIANGNVQFAYDSINFDGGHTFCAECSFQLHLLRRMFLPIAGLRRRRSCSHRPEPVRDVPKPGWLGFQCKHHQFVVYRRRAPFGNERSVCFGQLPIHRRGRRGRLDRHLAESHQFFNDFSSIGREQPIFDIAQRDAGDSQRRRQIGHSLCVSTQQLRSVQDRGGLSSGGLFQFSQSVFTDLSTDSSHDFAIGNLPGDGATPAKQFHGPRAVFDG